MGLVLPFVQERSLSRRYKEEGGDRGGETCDFDGRKADRLGGVIQSQRRQRATMVRREEENFLSGAETRDDGLLQRAIFHVFFFVLCIRRAPVTWSPNNHSTRCRFILRR